MFVGDIGIEENHVWFDGIDQVPNVICVISGKELSGKRPCEFVCFGFGANYQDSIESHIRFPTERPMLSLRPKVYRCYGRQSGGETLIFLLDVPIIIVFECA